MSIKQEMANALASARADPGRRFYIADTRHNVIMRHGGGRRAVWYTGTEKRSRARVLKKMMFEQIPF